VNLLIIRHAIAVPHGTPGFTDAERPLTEKGISRFREAAAGLAAILPPPAAILTSPWTRARETAEIASKAWGGPEPADTPCLAEWDLDELQRSLSGFGGNDTVAIVGHEPHFSSLVAMLVGSPRGERVEFKKGGAALVAIAGTIRGGGLLIWHLPPRILRRLAGS
jgi:phosphohistidine phosphatase